MTVYISDFETRTTTPRQKAWDIAATVCDPEIPVLTIEDLGILRKADVGPDGSARVTITPTYSGCPAMDAIRDDLKAAFAKRGYGNVEVHLVLSPAWTTDWMTESGRRKLLAYGIAPPGRTGGRRRVLFGEETVACLRCGSTEATRLAEFGSTACKALWRCEACREPFDHFRCH